MPDGLSLDPYEVLGVGRGARLWTLLEFFLLCFNPRIRSDLHFPGDRMLA